MTRPSPSSGFAFNEEYLRQGSPAAMFAESIPRWAAGADLAIAASGVVLSTGVPLQYGEVVTSISFVTGATAAVAPTAGFAALYSPAGALLAQTADFGSTARAANTAYKVALATAQLITTPGLYYVAISFTVSTTVPTLRGASVLNGVVAGAAGVSAAVLCQSHGSAVGAVAPATITAATTTFGIPYLALT